MRGSIVVLLAVAAIGQATPAFAELMTLDAVVFSSVPLAQMTPQMETYFVTQKNGHDVWFAARCALLHGNTTRPVRPGRQN